MTMIAYSPVTCASAPRLGTLPSSVLSVHLRHSQISQHETRIVRRRHCNLFPIFLCPSIKVSTFPPPLIASPVLRQVETWCQCGKNRVAHCHQEVHKQHVPEPTCRQSHPHNTLSEGKVPRNCFRSRNEVPSPRLLYPCPHLECTAKIVPPNFP